MIGVTSLVTMVSLWLAMAVNGGAAKQQAVVNSPPRQIVPSKIAINHNETMLSDEAPVPQANVWSDLLTSMEGLFFTRSIPGGCDEYGCGSNHNETMVSDATSGQQVVAWSQWLTSAQIFVFTKLLTYAPGGKGGSDDGCGLLRPPPDPLEGTNHNETMLHDTAR